MDTYGTLTSVKTSTKEVFTSNGGSVVVTITCDWDDRDTYTPDIGTAYGGDADFKLNSIQRETTPAGLAKITLNYSILETDEDDLPPTSYNEQSSQVEVDIKLHPSFSDWEADWDEETGGFVSGSDKYGITSYIIGSTTVTVNKYYTSNPASERASIGTLESPGGAYGSSANWLLVGANRSKQGNYFVMSKSYLYSAVPYNEDIYS